MHLPHSAIFLNRVIFQDSECQSKVIGPEPQYLDEFTSLLVPDDTRVMVDLLKLAVSCRSGEKGREVLSAVLSGMGTAYPQVITSFLHLKIYIYTNHICIFVLKLITWQLAVWSTGLVCVLSHLVRLLQYGHFLPIIEIVTEL